MSLPLIFLLYVQFRLTWLVGVFLAGVAIYNNLIFKKNQVEQAFSCIDVLLKKRYNLIPNFVAVFKSYSKFDGESLVEVTRLRSTVLRAKTQEEIRL